MSVLNIQKLRNASDDNLNIAFESFSSRGMDDAANQVRLEIERRQQGLDSTNNFDSRRIATQRILSGQFITDIDNQLKEEGIRPFFSPELTGGFLPGSPIGGGGMSMRNPGYKVERDRRIKEGLLKELSEARNLDKSQIDVTSGLGSNVRRGLLSFQETPENKENYLVDIYGRDNVIAFSIGNKPSFLVREGDKEVLVDEQGAAFGDVLDLIRPGAVLTAELIGAVLAPKQAIARAPILARSVTAGVGAGAGELLSEAIESGSTADSFSDFTGDIQVGQSALRGATATAIDYGFSKPFTLVAKAFTAPGVQGTDLSQEDFLKVLQRMQERTGVKIADQTTPSMRAGTDATIREGEVVDALRARAGSSTPDAMQAPAVRNRMAFNDALETVIRKIQGDEVPFEELSRIGQENFKALSKAALDAGEGASDFASRAVSRYFDDLSENVLPTLERKTSRQLGEDLTTTVKNIFNANKNEVDALYDEALSMGENIPGIDMLKVARRLLNIDGLSKELPTDINDEVIRSFIPKNVLIQLSKSADLSKQAKARLRQIAQFENAKIGLEGDQFSFADLLMGTGPTDPGEPLELSFTQLLNAKKELGRVYGQAARGDYLQRKQLKSMIDSLDGLMEGMARDANSPAFDTLQRANKLWKEKRLPLLEDRDLQSILGNSKRQLSPSEITNALINPRKGQVAGIVALRNASPDPDEFTRIIRNSAIDAIFNTVENQSDSLISAEKLKQILKNNDLVDEFFDKQTIKNLNRLLNVYKSRSKDLLGLPNSATVTPSTLRRLLEGDQLTMSDSDRAILNGMLNDEFRLSQRKLAIDKNQASNLLRAGGGNVTTNLNSTVNALLNLNSAADVKVFMDSLDDTARESIRASVRARIFDGASSGTGARTGELFGGARLPDANSDIFKQLRKPRSTEREVALDILGEDGLQDVLDIITVLDRVGMEIQQTTTGLLRADQAQLIGRGGSSARTFMPRAILGFNLEVPINKFLGIALASENFVNLVNRGRPADFTLAMLPAIFSSDNAFQVFIEMAAEDPRLIGGLDTIPTNAEVDSSELLK